MPTYLILASITCAGLGQAVPAVICFCIALYLMETRPLH